MHSVCSKLNQPKLITDKDDFSKIFKTNVATVQKPTSKCFDLFLHDPNNGINCLTNKSCHVFVNCKVAYFWGIKIHWKNGKRNTNRKLFEDYFI